VKRTATLLISLISTVTAFGQATTPASDAVKWAFQNLNDDRSIRVRLTGTDTLGSTETTLAGELYWWLSEPIGGRGEISAKVEFTDYRNGTLVQRAVGDGRAFFNYSPQRNNYWVTSYGTHGPTQPQRYLVNLVDDFTSAMKGSSTYLARLLREVYVVNGFRAWVPGGLERLVNVIGEPVPDPVIPTRVYVATDTTQYAMFWIGSPARKSIVFELTLGSGSPQEISRIYFAEKSTLGGQARLVDWTSEVFTNFTPAAESFVFTAPSNAKPVVGPRPNIG